MYLLLLMQVFESAGPAWNPIIYRTGVRVHIPVQGLIIPG